MNHLSFTDAAEKILKEYGAKKPIHYKKIIQIALKKKLISTKGLTPETTLTAVLNSENRRKISRGEEPRFVAYGKGLYGLTEWQPKGILKDIQIKNKAVKEKLFNYLMKIHPKKFEEFIGALLAKLGFTNLEVTKYSSDGGIDVKGTLIVGTVIKTRMSVQVKRWKNNIPSKVVRELRGGLSTHEQGLIITTSDFSKSAIDEANRSDTQPVGLMNGKELIELLVENEIGIKKNEISILEIDNQFIKEQGLELEEKEKIDTNSIPIFGKTKGVKYTTVLINLKKVKLNNKIFNSPSGAAKQICKYPVDGWHFWKFKDRNGKLLPIDKLRKQNV